MRSNTKFIISAALLLGGSNLLNAGTYKAKVEPYDTVTVSAETAGRIVRLDPRDELKRLDKTVIVLDHALEDIQLANSRAKLLLLEEQVKLKRQQYDSIKSLKSQNRFTKDDYLSQLISLQMQAQDLRNTIAQLEDTIAKKELAVKGRYLKKLYVREGEYVAPGTKLMLLEDQSGGRLILYVDAADRDALAKGQVRVEGAQGWKVEKAATTTDETYVSYYRVDLVKKGEVPYGKIVTVRIEPGK